MQIVLSFKHESTAQPRSLRQLMPLVFQTDFTFQTNGNYTYLISHYYWLINPSGFMFKIKDWNGNCMWKINISLLQQITPKHSNPSKDAPWRDRHFKMPRVANNLIHEMGFHMVPILSKSVQPFRRDAIRKMGRNCFNIIDFQKSSVCC